ncbi:MAG: sugar transferase [Acidimicrobiia bacterium]
MRRAARPLLYAGVLVVVFGLALVHARYIGHYPYTGSARFGWTVAYAALLCVAAYAVGLPDVPRSRRAALPHAMLAAGGAAGAMSALQLVLGDALLPRFVVFGSAVLLVDWFGACTGLAIGGRARAEARDRVAVVGTPDDVAELREELAGAPEHPAAVVVELDHAAAREGLAEVAVAEGATVLVLDRAALADERLVAQAAALHEAGLRVRTLSGFYEQWLGKLPIAELEQASLLFDIGEVHRARYVRSKRVVDVALALAGTVALAVVLPVVLVGDLVANRGPLLYRQARVGKGGREFTMLKFRTMRPSAAGSPTEWTGARDPRVTPFGRVLRRTHLDELPQVLNILRGDLSVVGPRPEQPAYVAELTEKLPFYRLRHVVRPGLTGWAQVKYGYAGSESDALQKLQYEFWYLRNQGLVTDLRIVGRTIRSMLGGEGAGR